jgi:hypothetical protein
LPDRTAQRLIERPSALADAKWIAEQRLPQSFKSLKTPLRLSDADIKLRQTYRTWDTFRQFAECAKTEAGWRYYEIDASHSPHVTASEALAGLLQTIVLERGVETATAVGRPSDSNDHAAFSAAERDSIACIFFRTRRGTDHSVPPLLAMISNDFCLKGESL